MDEMGRYRMCHARFNERPLHEPATESELEERIR